ncbi:DUF1048 domain-containing protein [Caulobacter mirabilis]|uniref:DUF1048 domain-containing protein n=1 Tax=Caulobacter mirabilis TaxID=69666 RepID=A0A2D2B2F1_9CAUL|nr:DUF1048 domain-containing protein [Caulobacter mirabilis]ATQ44445.1 hypothetical protein CSW64_19680 [Caulobacter mirabilis]
MAIGWIELVTGSLEQKKQYRECKARIKRLPATYRAAFEALERYLMYAGGVAKGDVAVRMYGDLVDLFEESAANGVPVREIFGEDPATFVEAFIANYADGHWINKERDRLIEAIDRASGGRA